METNQQLKAKGVEKKVPLSSLLLDPENPRLPADMQGKSQEDLAVHLELGFDALTVAESIASHGFFGSEPLIVIKDDGTPDGAERWIVVEGNRRLTALLGLTNSKIRSKFATPEPWEQLAAQVGTSMTINDVVPVVVEDSREAAAPIIGFRHISGILQWKPYAQARYIARLVDEGKQSFAEISKTIGIDKTKVQNLYRDQALAKQARALGIDTSAMEEEFSLVTVAMGIVKLRDHIGAPMGSKIEPGVDPIPADRVPQLKELITWIYGSGSTAPVIKDSREMNRLGNVIATEIGLKAIQSGESLDKAEQKIKDADDNPRDRLIKRLQTARSALKGAMDDIADFEEDEAVRDLIDEARDYVDALLDATGGE